MRNTLIETPVAGQGPHRPGTYRPSSAELEYARKAINRHREDPETLRCRYCAEPWGIGRPCKTFRWAVLVGSRYFPPVSIDRIEWRVPPWWLCATRELDLGGLRSLLTNKQPSALSHGLAIEGR